MIASISSMSLQQALAHYSDLVAYYDKLMAMGLVAAAAIVWAAIVLVMILILRLMK